MFDPVTDAVLTALFGMLMGALMFWTTTPKGQVFMITRVLKKPARIWVNFVAGKLLGIKVVVPKESVLKQGEKTLLPNWYAADAPIYREIGSTAAYIFTFDGSTDLFDPEKVEFGVYEHSQESRTYLIKGDEIYKRNIALKEEYAKYAAEGKVEEANKLAKKINENNERIMALVDKANKAREFVRVQSNPMMTTSILDTVKNMAEAKIYKGFLGQLEKLVRNLFLLLVVSAIASVVGAVLTGYIAFYKLH